MEDGSVLEDYGVCDACIVRVIIRRGKSSLVSSPVRQRAQASPLKSPSRASPGLAPTEVLP